MDKGASWSDYYKTPKWAKKRNERLKIDGFKCARCGFARALEVHHINYERFGDEDVARDLITLCKKCHKDIEEQKAIQDKTATVFELIPAGSYRFVVKSHSIGYSNSDKFPPNTQTVDCFLEIPYYKDGKLKITTVINKLFICSRMLFAVRRFTDCIGLTPEHGRAVVNLDEIDGKTGICAITTSTSYKGNKYNKAYDFYAPSKFPPITMNDEAWYEYINFLKED
jgi:hypothetical protein